MKGLFKAGTIRRWKSTGKRVLSLVLMFALVAGYVSWDNFGEVYAEEETLKLPSKRIPRINIMSEQMSEVVDLYRTYDNADIAFYKASGDPIETDDGTGGYTLSHREFQGRGTIGYRYFSNVGWFSLYVTLKPPKRAETESPTFKPYFLVDRYSKDCNFKNLSVRLAYTQEFSSKYSDFGGTSGVVKHDTGTKTTEWGNTNLYGNALYYYYDIMVIVADRIMPKAKDYTQEVRDGVSTLWLSCGEGIRPANDSITKSKLANMKLKVTLVKKYDDITADNAVVVYYEGTDLDYSDSNGRIGFTAVSSEKLSKISDYKKLSAEEKAKVMGAEQLNGSDWHLISIEDASEEVEYPLSGVVNTDRSRWAQELRDTGLKVSSPITDYAGNPVELEEKLDYTDKYTYIDLSSPTIVSSNLTGSMIRGNGAAEIARPDMFAGVGEEVSLSLTLSEEVFLDDEANRENVYLTWEATDNGVLIVTKLKEVRTISNSVNTGNVSQLVFEPIKITADMSGRIAPARSKEGCMLIGAEHLADASGNPLNGDMQNAYPDRSMTIDTLGPSIELGEVQQVEMEREDPKRIKYYVIPFTVRDGFDNTEAEGAGIVDYRNEDMLQYLSLTTDSKTDTLDWDFCISKSATDKLEGYIWSGSDRTNREELFFLRGEGTYYLHLTLISDGKQISDTTEFALNFRLTDAKGNTSIIEKAVLFSNLGLDKVGPSITVTPGATKIERPEDVSEEYNKVTFSAKIKSDDLNGVEQVYYQWTDMGSSAAENAWILIENGATVSSVNDVQVAVGYIEKQLWVKAVDKNGNVSTYKTSAETFKASVIRTNPQYTVLYDDTVAGGIRDVLVSAPISTNGTVGGAVRVTFRLPNGTNYTAVYDFSEEKGNLDKTYSIFDIKSAKWRKVGLGTDKYGVCQKEQPDWTTYYGKMSICFEASAENDLMPEIDGAIVPDGDNTYQAGSQFEVTHIGKRTDVHTITFKEVLDGSGEVMTGTYFNYDVSGHYYNVGANPEGVRISFTIQNQKMSELGSSDVDFENSYAVLVKTNAGGSAYVNYIEKIALSEGTEQTIALPYLEKGYSSGAYQLEIHLKQKGGNDGGAMQKFALKQFILVDNESMPEYIGVTEYDRNVWVGEDLNIDMGESGDITRWGGITSIEIGIGKKEMENAEIVYVDGKPAFTMTSTNSAQSSRLSFTIRAQRERITKVLGKTLGQMDGFRIWNQASSGDSSELEWNKSGGRLTFMEGYAQADMSEIIYGYSSIVVDAKTLAETDISEFKLQEGHNVICYQWRFSNGKISPVYTFEINLYDKLPTVEASYELGNTLTSTEYICENVYGVYPIKGCDYERIYSDSYALKVERAYSPNGELKVYRASYDASGSGSWSLNPVDASKPIEILTSGTDGYAGVDGMRKNNTTGKVEVTEFYVFVDAIGNARCLYPIISEVDEYGNESKNSTADALTDSGGVKYETDENGSLWAVGMAENAEAKMYYYSKNPNVGTLNITSQEPHEPMYPSEETDPAWESVYSIFGYSMTHFVEQISITIDDRAEYLWEDLTKSQTPGINSAGVIKQESNSGQCSISYQFPYDASKADGEEITHKVTIRGYIDGEIAKDSNGREAVMEFTITAKNIKPAITQSGTPEIGRVDVVSNAYLYAQGITENAQGSIYASAFPMKLYQDGIYQQGFYDKYGVYYELNLAVTDMPADPRVTISNTQITKDPVQIVIESGAEKGGGSLTLQDGTVFPEGSAVEGEGTSKLTITLTDNAEFTIICTYGDGSVTTVPIGISNIYTKPIVPIVQWAYNKYKVDPVDNSYEGNVTAYLVDANGSPLTDLATGAVVSFTFVPGGQTSYTFSNYVNIVGVIGEDVTVQLPVNLKVPGGIETAENDKYAPSVGIMGYAKYKSEVLELAGVLIAEDISRPGYGTEDAQIALKDYADIYPDYALYSQPKDLLALAALAEKYILELDIRDESAVRIFLAADRYAQIPDYTTGTSDVIEGVSVVGRTLQITANVEFALHIVDEKGNATSFYFEVTNLGEEMPKPTTTQIVTKSGNEVRVYFDMSKLAGITEFTVADAKIEEDATSDFYGKPYVAYTTNYPDGVTVGYSYKYQNQLVEGSVIVKITELDTAPPRLLENQIKWSANYDGAGVKYTNTDITAQLIFDKKLASISFVDENGNLIETPQTVSVAYLEDRVTIIYSGNTKGLRLKVTGAANRQTNIIPLPEVKTIDKDAAQITYQEELSENHRKAVVLFTSTEEVCWPDGHKSLAYRMTVTENGYYTVSVSDRAGNITEKKVRITSLVEGDLDLYLSYDKDGINPIQPEEDHVEIGDVIYVMTSRDAVVTLNGDDTKKLYTTAGEWKALTITEDSEGLYPAIRAVDAYGNAAVVQLLQIPLKDRTKPSLLLNKSMISISLDATREELEKLLKSNYVASDNATSAENLVFTYELAEVSGAGKYAVTYRVTDEAGNSAETTGWIRFYDGQEIRIMLNGELVEREATIIVSSGTQTITIMHNGEPYKVEWRKGIRSLGQMKNQTNVLTEYTDVRENELTIDFTEAGYYTFLVTTQSRDTYRFVIYVGENL